MNINERIERLQSYHLEGRIIRKAWHEGALLSDGYERACLLAAFSPEAAEDKTSAACPASAMPPWLAYLTPSLDDNVSDEAWPSVIARYVEVIPKLVRLPADRLVRLDFETRAIAVREGRSHTTIPKVLAAIDGALVLLDLAARGQEVTRATQAAAEAEAAAASAAWAAASAAWAAEAEAKAAAKAAAWAALEETAKSAAREAALRASWDRMADAMLSAWERAASTERNPT